MPESLSSRQREVLVWLACALLLAVLALLRPIDHDESQYVAATVLTAHGLLPYRDFAYLQTPLQPLLFAPLTRLAGVWTWPALRLASALGGAATLGFTWRAARQVAPERVALAAVALFGCCDIFLFSVGTARNDALPAACLAAAMAMAVRADRVGTSRAGAAATGLLLAGAAAAKISYAVPAAAYAGWALLHRAHRPAWVALGAAPVAIFVAWTAALAPAGFLFGALRFPALAPADFYAARPWKLSLAAKLFDTVKFLALGPALLATIVVARRQAGLPFWLAAAGLVAALLPTPTWRQYLLPLLPALFVLLAQRWAEHPPSSATRWLAGVFVLAGLTPTAAALASGAPALGTGQRYGAAIGAAMDAAGITGPVATLSPQFLPATGRLPDARFATGPFYFRTRRLAADESAFHLVSARTLPCAPLPAILVGGEGPWTSGDAALDRALERVAVARGYREQDIAGTPFRLYVQPEAQARPIVRRIDNAGPP